MTARHTNNTIPSDLYCICHTPYDKNQSYIGCDQCDNWYHLSCVNMNEYDAEHSETYVCNHCVNTNNHKKRKYSTNNTLHDRFKSIGGLDDITQIEHAPSVIRDIHSQLHGATNNNNNNKKSNQSVFRQKMKLYKSKYHRLCDVLIIDTPYQSIDNTINKTEYYGNGKIKKLLTDQQIINLPVHLIQHSGYLFMYTPLHKYQHTIQCMNEWGYTIIHEIDYIYNDASNNGNQPGNITKNTMKLNHQTTIKLPSNTDGITQSIDYTNHTVERIVIGQIGSEPDLLTSYCTPSDTLYSTSSQYNNRPIELYNIIESMIPNGNYIQLFGYMRRRNWYWLQYDDVLSEINHSVKLENEINQITDDQHSADNI